MIRSVLCMVLCVSGVLSLTDTTTCEGAYDISAGTAICGGFDVSVKALVCGDGFSQERCYAKYTNAKAEQEEFFFMGAGDGIAKSALPEGCSGLQIATGIAMVQFYPDTKACYLASELDGTKILYSRGFDSTPASITLVFPGANVRSGYLEIKCNEGITNPKFDTTGDAGDSNTYAVNTTAACGGGKAPSIAEGGKVGGLLLGLFFGGGAVYLVGGFAYNIKVRQLEGIDRIPHRDFWSSLPGLAKEGFRFTKSKATKTDYTPL